MSKSKESYGLGDRVHLSALGKSRTLKGNDKRGEVIGFGQTDSIIRVQFDDLDCPVSLHRSYLERDARAELEARYRLSH